MSSNYPPGVSGADIDRLFADRPCEVCGHAAENCECLDVVLIVDDQGHPVRPLQWVVVYVDAEGKSYDFLSEARHAVYLDAWREMNQHHKHLALNRERQKPGLFDDLPPGHMFC